MASFALLPIFAGFKFDLPNGVIGFNPVVNKDNFKCLFSLGTGWGQVRITEKETSIVIKDGALSLKEISLPYLKEVKEIIADGEKIDFSFEGGSLKFAKTTVKKEITVR